MKRILILVVLALFTVFASAAALASPSVPSTPQPAIVAAGSGLTSAIYSHIVVSAPGSNVVLPYSAITVFDTSPPLSGLSASIITTPTTTTTTAATGTYDAIPERRPALLKQQQTSTIQLFQF